MTYGKSFRVGFLMTTSSKTCGGVYKVTGVTERLYDKGGMDMRYLLETGKTGCSKCGTVATVVRIQKYADPSSVILGIRNPSQFWGQCPKCKAFFETMGPVWDIQYEKR